ncbi:hypothetical protein HK096_003768 [Nowakowskiella sp. JEL0078]|nr:hypothetical protein HK096_003768 [Nowakowskiella sp. JEL0078]
MAQDLFLDSLPYIDKDLDNQAIHDKVRSLIAEERRAPTSSNFSAVLPPEIDLFSTNELLKLEMLRVNTEMPLQALNLSSYRLEAPEADNLNSADVENAWSKAVANGHAQLESQHNRLINLELINKFGANAWRLHNFQLEQMNLTIKAAVERNSVRVVDINKNRKVDQVAANVKLQQLDNEWKELISKVLQVEFANKALEAEIESLKAQLEENARE